MSIDQVSLKVDLRSKAGWLRPRAAFEQSSFLINDEDFATGYSVYPKNLTEGGFWGNRSVPGDSERGRTYLQIHSVSFLSSLIVPQGRESGCHSNVAAMQSTDNRNRNQATGTGHGFRFGRGARGITI